MGTHLSDLNNHLFAQLERENAELKAYVEALHESKVYFKNGMAELQDYIDKMEPEYDALAAQVEKLQQSLLKCAELVNVDGGTAIDWLIDNHHDLRQQAKAGE